MDLRQMEVYLERLSQLKKEYDGQISILTGLETDFISGYEEETAAFLNTYGPSLDDGILSVHFLKTYRLIYASILTSTRFSSLPTASEALKPYMNNTMKPCILPL